MSRKQMLSLLARKLWNGLKMGDFNVYLFIYFISSPEPLGSQGELIGWP